MPQKVQKGRLYIGRTEGSVELGSRKKDWQKEDGFGKDEILFLNSDVFDKIIEIKGEVPINGVRKVKSITVELY